MQKMKNEPPRKLMGVTSDGKKVVFRRKNPKVVFTFLAVIVASSLLVYGVIILFDEFALMFSAAMISVLLSWFIQVHNLIREERQHATSLCARIDGVRFKNNKIIVTVKNIGSSNITQASLGDFLINEKISIGIPIMINLLPVGEIAEVSLEWPCRLSYMRKLSYKIGVEYGNTYVMLAYEQELRSRNGKCTMRNNTCKLKTWIYHRWWI